MGNVVFIIAIEKSQSSFQVVLSGHKKPLEMVHKGKLPRSQISPLEELGDI